MASAARTTRPPKVRKARFVMLDELLAGLGVPASRVRLDPPPGTATARDVLRIRRREGRLFELVDGTLVEKPMSADASLVAVTLVQVFALHFGAANKLGVFLGADGFLRISTRYVRAPDVSFIRRDQLPGGKFPRQPIPALAPDLAVEVLSPTNTPAEMARKRKEYFDSGVRLVWVIDPKARTAGVYTSPDDVTALGPADTLTGGDVLPGFAVKVADLFADLADEPTPKPKKARPKRKPKK
ncbi:MAG: Uma2 family endonuclease [Gemmataceae bacterium]|nr:Uma2 family endonuclease [Gemmataceae bacterium]